MRNTGMHNLFADISTPHIDQALENILRPSHIAYRKDLKDSLGLRPAQFTQMSRSREHARKSDKYLWPPMVTSLH